MYVEPKKNKKDGLGNQSTDRPADYKDNGPFYKQGRAKGCGDEEAIATLQKAGPTSATVYNKGSK